MMCKVGLLCKRKDLKMSQDLTYGNLHHNSDQLSTSVAPPC